VLERSAHLVDAGAPVLAGQLPRAGVAGHRRQIARPDRAPPVPLARQREDGVRAGVDAAVDVAGPAAVPAEEPVGAGLS